MKYIFFKELDSSKRHPKVADFLAGDRWDEWSPASSCFFSPQEAEAAKPGDRPNGTVEECEDHAGPFQRIWHDPSACWYHTYGVMPPDAPTPPEGYAYTEKEIP